MCELLGLGFNTEVTVQLAFSGLKAGATENPDRWGVAWYDEHGTQLIKEAKPVDRSRLAKSFLGNLDARSRIFVSHIRRATAGSAGYCNTHPFCRRFNQKTYIFAHNGAIDSDKMDLSSRQFKPIGETDSDFKNWLSNLPNVENIQGLGGKGQKWLILRSTESTEGNSAVLNQLLRFSI